MKNFFHITNTGDGWRNLAIDEHLLNTLSPGEVCLLLYINDNAVVLGCNQNPWAECDLDKMEADGVQLVRRCSGGGAVYHDRGNLNYSFIASEDRYDEKRQTLLILRALARCGVEAVQSGRNDLTAGGRKFSGTAFCARGGNRQHHGTLLVNADLTRLSRYLTVAPQKLQSKGVKSVRARVCNLAEINPQISVDALSCALRTEFEAAFGQAETFPANFEKAPGIAELNERNSRTDWQLEKAPDFDFVFEDRLNFGIAQLYIKVKNGRIEKAKLYTDSLDILLPERVETRLVGRIFDIKKLPELVENAAKS